MMQCRFSARPVRFLAVLLCASAIAACDSIPTDSDLPARAQSLGTTGALTPTPSPLVTVNAGGAAWQIWPFTGTSIAANAQHSDPINLVFTGHADPRAIRAALIALEGNRPHLPPLPFFQCSWNDAMGDNQTGYSGHDGWTGSAIQLECGPYQGLRFHVRLFRAGDITLANAHFETIVPGTHQHEVLNWELAQQFVVGDMMRTGLLTAPPQLSSPINPWPYFRTIHPLIYSNPAMVPLHPVINAVVVSTPTGPTFGIRSNGRAVILDLAAGAAAQPGVTTQELVIQFNQVIPKPICAGPADYVMVQGPLRMRQDVTISAAGVFSRDWQVEGDLSVTPVNPMTGMPIGPTAQGVVSGAYKGMINDVIHSTTSLLEQTLLAPDGSVQTSKLQLQVGPNATTRFRLSEACGA